MKILESKYCNTKNYFGSQSYSSFKFLADRRLSACFLRIFFISEFDILNIDNITITIMKCMIIWPANI